MIPKEAEHAFDRAAVFFQVVLTSIFAPCYVRMSITITRRRQDKYQLSKLPVPFGCKFMNDAAAMKGVRSGV